MALNVLPIPAEAVAHPKARRGLLRTPRQRRDALWGLFFIGPQVIGLVAFSLIPVAYAFILSVMKWDGLGEREFIGLANFRDQFTDHRFLDAMVHTVIYTAIAVPGSVIFALLLALGVNHVRGKTIYRTIFFLPSITPVIASVLIWLWLLQPSIGVVNYMLGLIGILLVFTVAELMLSPVGLSLTTKLAPAVFKTQMVALFFLSVATPL